MPDSRAVFLDKDGTLVKDIPFNVDPGQIYLAPGVLEGLQALQEAGYRLLVVTNQSGIARGFFTARSMDVVEERLRELLAGGGVTLDGFYYCPHHPAGVVREYALTCTCRKPQPGLILRAAEEAGVELATSWLVGDILNDIEAGRRAGVRTILIENGNETEWILTAERKPDYRVADFYRAARVILQEDDP